MMVAVNRHVLITGIDGFTGRYVSAALERRGFEVSGTTQVASDHPKWHQADLLDATRLKFLIEDIAPTHIVHLAAVAFAASGDVEAMYRVNISGTRNLLAAAAGGQGTLRSIVMASSASVYGNASTSPINEDAAAQPSNDYAVSKLAMEYLARLWADRLPLTIARPFNYTGVGQDARFLIPKIVAAFRRLDPVIELGNLDVAREFSDVRDVAEDYAGLVESEATGTFNIASGVGYTIGEVLSLASAITGHRAEVEVNPSFVRSNDVKHLIGSNARLRGIVSGRPVREFSSTLRWMLEA